MKTFLTFLFFLHISTFTHATLIDSVDGLIDDESRLEWLDFNANVNLSYNDMIASDLNGFGAQGFRYATISEVGRLWRNAGFLSLPAEGSMFAGSADSIAAADLLISYLGANRTSASDTYIQAITGSAGELDGYVKGAYIRGTCRNGYGCATAGSYGQWQVHGDHESSYIGHWLVRELPPTSVPEPQTLIIFAFALVGLLVRRNKAFSI